MEANQPAIIDTLTKPNLKRHELSKPFIQTFRVSLGPFWNSTTGFDVIKFDEWLGVPDGESTENFVRTNYGEAGVAIIKRLISIE